MMMMTLVAALTRISGVGSGRMTVMTVMTGTDKNDRTGRNDPAGMTRPEPDLVVFCVDVNV